MEPNCPKEIKAAETKIALNLMHEWKPGSTFVFHDESIKGNHQFRCTVDVNGQTFEGRSRNKKGAKQLAAEMALKAAGKWPDSSSKANQGQSLLVNESTISAAGQLKRPMGSDTFHDDIASNGGLAKRQRVERVVQADLLSGGGDNRPQTDDRLGKQNESISFANDGENAAYSLLNISVSALSEPPPPDVHHAMYFPELSLSIPDDLYVALDCEFLGVGPKGSTSVLGRCSIINYSGAVIYDKFVRPREIVTDFHTRYSGIRPSDIGGASPMDAAMQEINQLLAHKVVVGHAVYNDFQVLGIQRQPHTVRDTTTCRYLTEMAGFPENKTGLKKLTAALLGRQIQVGKKGHCSVEDALASLDLFKLVRSRWEPELLRAWDKKGVDLRAAIADMVMMGAAR